ncbi:VCBS repeat-containing protein [Clostridium sp. JN-9]|uniref:VCBS repeat-containing protein n=1 Tax=Clostridium sp. JN-9 TaxID=2507159 RepID=UPI000FFE2B11|nr:VCBS repeat-containing protein [Clostridium sp. JN-9]QAT39387.1 VCBS repeat-containing protein [Clostridium sp. JN-9]
MKFKVLFLKKKYIYCFLLFLLLIILFIIFTATKNTSAALNTVNENKVIKADLNGDGTEDNLIITVDKMNYNITASIGNKNYNLVPSSQINTLGEYNSHWPLKVTIMDASRDKTPEIFIQSSYKNQAIVQVFNWTNNGFNNVYFGKNDIIGFVDYKNNRTPKLIFTNSTSDKFNFNNFIFLNKNLQKFNYSYNDNFMGKDTVYYFIKYIESLPHGESVKPLNIYYPGLSGKDLSVIGKLSGENNLYNFQDGIFMDTQWNKDGEVSQIKWVLNFKGVSKVNNENVKNYTLTILLKPDGNKDAACYYKIYSISLK